MAITQYPEKASEMARLVNTERLSAGLKPLYVVPHLNDVAMLRAKEASEYMSHTRPNGTDFITAIDTNIIDYGAVAENIAAGNEAAEATLEQWENSSSHWAEIVNENYTHMGMGVVYNPNGVNGYGWYWTQIFSNDLRGDVEYDGQYMAEPYTGTANIRLVDKSTNQDISGVQISVSVQSASLGGNINILTAKQNGEILETQVSNQKFLFTSSETPTEISGIVTGKYNINASLPEFYNGYFGGSSSMYVYQDGFISGGSDITLYVTPIRLLINLTDSETGQKIPDVVFSLSGYNDLSNISIVNSKNWIISDDKKAVTITTATDSAEIHKIPANSYTLTFLKTDGYKIPEDKSTSLYAYEGNTENISLVPISVTVDVYGINEESKQIPVSGAKFGLTSLDNGNLENVVCTGTDVSALVSAMKFTADSTTSLKYLPAGSYRLVELAPPDGYSPVQEITFSINENGEIINLTNAILVNDSTIKIVHSKNPPDLEVLTRNNVIKVFDISYKQEDYGNGNNGLAILQPSECTSTHNADIWDISLVHPLDDFGKWKKLTPENVLEVDGQLFRIDTQEVECSENGSFITVHANHISYDMTAKLIKDSYFEGGTAQNFIDFCFAQSHLDGFDDEFYPEYKFTGFSDIETFLDGDQYTNVTLLGAISGVDNCLVNRWGGEIFRDNFYFSVCKRMENAKDDAFILRYSHDISGIKQKIDYSDFCTLLECIDNFGNGWAVSYVDDSKWWVHHHRRRVYKFNYKDAETGYAQIDIDGMALWLTMCVPFTGYEITFASVKNDPRYSDFSILQNYRYGDSGTIYCPELDINTVQKITEVVKNEITGEIISMKLGNVANTIVRPTFLGSTLSTGRGISDNLDSRITKLESANIPDSTE